MADTALKAAAVLAEEHDVDAEVIDPRTLRPLDLDTILESVRKTNRAVIVEEGWPHGGVGANLSTLITEQAFDRSEEHTSELQSRQYLVCRLLLEKKKTTNRDTT